jgi:HSP20 family protein
MLGYLTNFDSDLYGLAERLRRDMDEAFGVWPGATGIRSVASGTYPAINIGVSPDRVDAYVFAPGLDPKALDVSLQQNLLTIAGERKVEAPENVQYYRRERFDGQFRRVLSLPEDVDPDKVAAAYKDGILHITVQRREAVKPRQIEIT